MYLTEHPRGQTLLKSLISWLCKWIPAAERLLEIQGVDSLTFRGHVIAALRHGRLKDTNVLIHGVPDAGKSFAFRPLGLIFETFITRGQNESFPLQGIHGSEICLLQDVRFESFGLPWDDWLRWGDGESMMVRLPRNAFDESKEYVGTAPLFATMATLFKYPLYMAKKFQRDVEYENEQFRSRWNIIRFPTSIPKHERNPTLKPCKGCGAKWYAGAVAAESIQEILSSIATKSDVAAPLLPEADDSRSVVAQAGEPPQQAIQQGGETFQQTASAAAAPKERTQETIAPSQPEIPQGHVQLDGDLFWARLSKLMTWREQGLLSPAEFATAKAALGL